MKPKIFTKHTRGFIRLTGLALFCSLFSFFSSAQTVQADLKGYARDTAGTPLPFVNIFTRADDSGAISAFATTDLKGYFTLRAPRGKTLIVKATFLGYTAEPFRVNEGKPVPEFINFTMRPSSFSLKETVIRGDSRVKRGDTITFSADKYRDSTERNLEELAAKLPGVDVDKTTGVISVEGTPIKKILIEGDDMTGHNYQLMSKNLPAEAVDKIQVISRFTDNKLLHGIKKTGDKALNIVLKSNHKDVIFGNASLNVGSGRRADAWLDLLQFNKKWKMLNVAKFNNIGEKETADGYSDFKEENEGQDLRALVDDAHPSIAAPGQAAGINRNTTFNQAALGSAHLLYHAGERVVLKEIFTISHDHEEIFTNKLTVYHLKDSILLLTENSRFLKTPLILRGQLEGQADLTDRSLLRYRMQWVNTNIGNDNRTLSNNNLILNSLSDKNNSVSHVVDYTYKLDAQKALIVNGVYNVTGGDANFNVAQSAPRFLPGLSDSVYNLRQTVGTPMTFYSLSSQLYYTSDARRIIVGAGAVGRSETLTSGLFNPASSVLPPATFQNNLQYDQKNYYGRLNWREMIQGVEVLGDLAGGYFRSQWQSADSAVNRYDGLYALPTLGFRRERDKTKLWFSYSLTSKLPQAADLSTGYILTDYRNLERGSAVFIPVNSHSVLTTYRYGDASDNFLASLSLTGSESYKGYRTNYFVTPDFIFNDKMENVLQSGSWSLRGSAEQYFENLFFRLKVRPSLSESSFQSAVNDGGLRQNTVWTKSLDLMTRSAYLGWFNFTVGSTLTQTKQLTQNGDQTTTLNNFSALSFADFNLKFFKRVIIRQDNEFYYSEQAGFAPQRYFYSNFMAQYMLFEKSFFATLTVRNIFNTQSFRSTFISDYTSGVTETRLLPRYILLGAQFKF